VRAIREGRGQSRLDVARVAADQTMRTLHTVSNQWCAWERGEKSPQLLSLVSYLHAHRLRLALEKLEGAPDSSPWCPARARTDRRQRCCVAVGHGGRHRDYAGNEF
jgi:hypothetical protein